MWKLKCHGLFSISKGGFNLDREFIFERDRTFEALTTLQKDLRRIRCCLLVWNCPRSHRPFSMRNICQVHNLQGWLHSSKLSWIELSETVDTSFLFHCSRAKMPRTSKQVERTDAMILRRFPRGSHATQEGLTKLNKQLDKVTLPTFACLTALHTYRKNMWAERRSYCSRLEKMVWNAWCLASWYQPALFLYLSPCRPSRERIWR